MKSLPQRPDLAAAAAEVAAAVDRIGADDYDARTWSRQLGRTPEQVADLLLELGRRGVVASVQPARGRNPYGALRSMRSAGVARVIDELIDGGLLSERVERRNGQEYVSLAVTDEGRRRL